MSGPGPSEALPAAQIVIEMRRSCPIDPPLAPRNSFDRGESGCARLIRVLGPGLLVCLLATAGCEEPSPQQRIANAEAHLQRGDTGRAIAELKQVLQAQPNDAAVRLMLGKLYLTSGDLPYAEKELGRARALGPASAELMAALGELWLKQGRPEQLLSELQPQEDWPQEARIAVHRLRARALAALGDLAGAGRAYEAMLHIAPDNVDARIGLVRIAMRAEDADASERMLAEALQIAPYHPTLLGLRGDLAFQRGAYADAADDYRRQLKAAPDSVAARLALAQALIAAGDYAAADALLDEFLAERPGNGLANYLRAASAFQTGDAEAVERHSERALDAMPTHAPSMFLLAAGSYALGRLEYAHWHLERVLARQPDHAPAQRLLAATDQQLALSARDDVDPLREGERLFRVDLASVQGVGPDADWTGQPEAADAGRLARAGDHVGAGNILGTLESGAPDSPALLELRGGLALLAGRPLAAVRAFEAAQERSPAAVLARKLALAQWRAGQRATSEATLEAWLTRVPDDFETQLTLADLHLAAGRPAATRQILTRVVTARPDDVTALNNLAWALLEEGRAAAARPLAERALRLAPHEPSVSDTLARALIELGEPDRAVELLRRATRAETSFPAIEVRLAQALAERGDQEEARSILRRLLVGAQTLPEHDQAAAQALLRDLGG
jgi:cellulose synthase operon protein C